VKFFAPLIRMDVYEMPVTEMLALIRMGAKVGLQSVEMVVPVAFVPEPAGHDKQSKPLMALRYGLNV